MLAVLLAAIMVWAGVLLWRRTQFLELSRRSRAQAEFYAHAQGPRADEVAEVADLEHEVAHAEPPAAGSDVGAWRAYREYVSDLKLKVNIARARLNEYERRRAVRQYFERRAAKYERAANTPWLRID
jgi:hypothetical protein